MIVRQRQDVVSTRGEPIRGFIVTLATGFFCTLPIAGLGDESFIAYDAGEGQVLFRPGNVEMLPALDSVKLHSVFPVLMQQRDTWVQIEGHYSQSADTITFEPRFPFIPGVGKYQAVIDWQTLWQDTADDTRIYPERTDFSFQPEAMTAATTRVVSLFPDAMEIPENILRIYVNFSGPIARGSLSDWIRLETEEGGEVSAFFLDNREPLWSRDRTRLTLLLDPSRVKRGVLANRTIGRALRQDKTYRLIISSKMIDAAGHSLLGDFEHIFTVGPPVEMALTMDDVHVSKIKVGTSEPIEISFLSIMDYFQLSERLTIKRDGQDIVAGRLSIGTQPSSVMFTPELPWQAQDYVLHIASDVEDVSGNTFLASFDQDPTIGVARNLLQDQHETRDLVLDASYGRPGHLNWVDSGSRR